MVPGRGAALLMLLFAVGSIWYFMQRARRGQVPTVRPIAGLQATAEAVGRATEMGRPVFYVPGRTEINTAGAAQTLAGLEMLGYVAELSARYEVPLRTAVAAPTVLPVAEEMVRQGYQRAGKPDLYRPEFVQFLSSEQFAFAAGCLDIMHREKVGAAFLIGEFQAESLMLAEGAAQVGAIVISGTARTFQIPFFVVASDYTLIGEEIFAAGAYLSGDRDRLGGLAGQDWTKILAVALMLVGAILVTFGQQAIVRFLSW